MIAGDHQGRVQLVIGLPAQGATDAPVIGRIGILAAIGTGIVHPAIFITGVAHQAKSKLVLDQRYIDHAAEAQSI